MEKVTKPIMGVTFVDRMDQKLLYLPCVVQVDSVEID